MRIFGFLSKKVGDLTVKYSNLPESYIKEAMNRYKSATPYKIVVFSEHNL